MSDNNVFQINGKKGSGSSTKQKTIFQICHRKNIARTHAKLLSKIKICEDNGKNPADQMPVQIGCDCGEQFGFPDFMALPIFNIQCPTCKKILLEWVIKE